MMNTVQFGQATAPTGPEPVEGQPTPPPPVPEQKHFNWHWRRWILVCLAVIVLSSAIAYIAHRPSLIAQLQSPKSTPIPTQTVQTSISPTPTPDPTANWKLYSSGILYFKYPPTYTVKETDKDHFIVYHQNTHPINAEFLIDARLAGNLSNFENAVSRTKEDIKNASVQQLMNGVKITGILGPGYGEGAFVIAVYFKYQDAAVLFNTNTEDEEKIKIFDQMLSTFKFVDQTSYSCPASEYINCMPSLGPGGERLDKCDETYIAWAKTNCPGFKGAAY